MDNFTIIIDVSGKKLSSIVFSIVKVAEHVKNKIHIINFTEENVKEYFSIDENKSTEFIENTKYIVDKLVHTYILTSTIFWDDVVVYLLLSMRFIIVKYLGHSLEIRFVATIVLFSYI